MKSRNFYQHGIFLKKSLKFFLNKTFFSPSLSSIMMVFTVQNIHIERDI